VLFDFEGTLVDFQWKLDEGEAALRDAFVRAGVSPDSLEGLSYSSMWNEVMRATASCEQAALRHALGPVYDRYDLDALSRWSLRAGSAEAVRGLGTRGVRAGLVSNIGRLALEQALARFGLFGLLAPVLSRDDVRFMKPDPEGIDRALASWGIPSAAALFVGDSLTDVRAARAAGVRVAIIAGGESSAEALAALPPDVVLGGVSDVLGLV
jgi:phosphoglycolate phosphatase